MTTIWKLVKHSIDLVMIVIFALAVTGKE